MSSTASASRNESHCRPRVARSHVLLMTATPIPQVLGQVIHADLDVSDLRAAPGRSAR